MADSAAIIGLTQWLQTPAGRYLLAWEQQRLDPVVADLFGFHALQLGLPELDGLAANRMPHRWTAVDNALAAHPAYPLATQAARAAIAGEPPPLDLDPPLRPGTPAALCCDFDALPFDSQSLDLVLLPHALELAGDPHQTLREVERVLVPEGRVVILGFNPTSLWGLRQQLGQGVRRLRGQGSAEPFLPGAGEFIAYRRLRDWLRLLSFEVERAQFGCYRPPLRTQAWLSRFSWMENAGERWWPVLGAVYLLVAVKRVRGMRLVGLAPRQPPAKAPAAVVAHQRHHRGRGEPPG